MDLSIFEYRAFPEIILVFVYALGWNKLLEFGPDGVLIDIFHKFYEQRLLFSYLPTFHLNSESTSWKKISFLKFFISNHIE